MNKIMALAVEIAHETSEWTRSNPMGKAGRKYTDVPSYAALQSEVNRVEAELATLRAKVAGAYEAGQRDMLERRLRQLMMKTGIGK